MHYTGHSIYRVNTRVHLALPKLNFQSPTSLPAEGALWHHGYDGLPGLNRLHMQQSQETQVSAKDARAAIARDPTGTESRDVQGHGH